ncbi:unnamed protein product [Polarella glacialis]|uniref:Uncharacterized protein n=1 Tax=Polarella glacialis TaxID=89957 RepID=A0A813G610_POLGL|nr:unnamed protein product [Polarella glacialis]
MTLDAELLLKMQRQRRRLGELAAPLGELPDNVRVETQDKGSTGKVRRRCFQLEGVENQSPSSPPKDCKEEEEEEEVEEEVLGRLHDWEEEPLEEPSSRSDAVTRLPSSESPMQSSPGNTSRLSSWSAAVPESSLVLVSAPLVSSDLCEGQLAPQGNDSVVIEAVAPLDLGQVQSEEQEQEQVERPSNEILAYLPKDETVVQVRPHEGQSQESEAELPASSDLMEQLEEVASHDEPGGIDPHLAAIIADLAELAEERRRTPPSAAAAETPSEARVEIRGFSLAATAQRRLAMRDGGRSDSRRPAVREAFRDLSPVDELQVMWVPHPGRSASSGRRNASPSWSPGPLRCREVVDPSVGRLGGRGASPSSRSPVRHEAFPPCGQVVSAASCGVPGRLRGEAGRSCSSRSPSPRLGPPTETAPVHKPRGGCAGDVPLSRSPPPSPRLGCRNMAPQVPAVFGRSSGRWVGVEGGRAASSRSPEAPLCHARRGLASRVVSAASAPTSKSGSEVVQSPRGLRSQASAPSIVSASCCGGVGPEEARRHLDRGTAQRPLQRRAGCDGGSPSGGSPRGVTSRRPACPGSPGSQFRAVRNEVGPAVFTGEAQLERLSEELLKSSQVRRRELGALGVDLALPQRPPNAPRVPAQQGASSEPPEVLARRECVARSRQATARGAPSTHGARRTAGPSSGAVIL